MRFDSGFWSNETITRLVRLNVRYTMAVRTNTPTIAAVIAGIAEGAWVEIDYTDDGQAQVAECVYNGRRLVVRRTRLTDRHQAKLWPDWRHFGFLTDLDDDTVTIDAFHRQHAVVELTIRDLKEGAGMEHVPSGNFSANSAWLQCAVIAHNLIRWTATLGAEQPVDRLTVARTIRTRLIAIPGRLVNLAGTDMGAPPRRWLPGQCLPSCRNHGVLDLQHPGPWYRAAQLHVPPHRSAPLPTDVRRSDRSRRRAGAVPDLQSVGPLGSVRPIRRRRLTDRATR